MCLTFLFPSTLKIKTHLQLWLHFYFSFFVYCPHCWTLFVIGPWYWYLAVAFFLTYWYTTEVITQIGLMTFCHFTIHSVSFIDTCYYFFHWCFLSYLHKLSVFTAGFLCHFPQWGWISSQPHLVSLSMLSWELRRFGTWMTPWMYEAHPYISIRLSTVLCSAVFSLGFKYADIVKHYESAVNNSTGSGSTAWIWSDTCLLCVQMHTKKCT